MSWPAKNDKTRNSRFYDLRIDEEVYTSLETVNNSCTIEFILGCCQSLSLDKRECFHDTIMDWYSSVNIIS